MMLHQVEVFVVEAWIGGAWKHVLTTLDEFAAYSDAKWRARELGTESRVHKYICVPTSPTGEQIARYEE